MKRRRKIMHIKENPDFRCKNCRYYNNTGECHRKPLPLIDSDDFIRYWVQVNTTDWCGEFKPDKDLEEKNGINENDEIETFLYKLFKGDVTEH